MSSALKYTGIAVLTFATCLLVYAVGAITFDNFQQAEPGGSESTVESGKDLKTYTSDLGFSFSYPPQLEVLNLSNQIILMSMDGGDRGSIVVSIGLNDENMTAEEWLLSPNSGYLQSKDNYGEYHKTIVGGQEAVYTDEGMWVITNTPGNEYRLSVAGVPSEDGLELFAAMDIVIDSLVFNR